jgi:hypothetical protein
MDRLGCLAELEDVLGFFQRELQPTPSRGEPSGAPSKGATIAQAGQEESPAHPDGPDGGCWLWWQGTKHDIPKGVVYRLLAFMWEKDQANYETLERHVFDLEVKEGTIRARASDVNKKVLEPIGVPWRLSADSSNRYLTKKTASKKPLD